MSLPVRQICSQVVRFCISTPVIRSSVVRSCFFQPLPFVPPLSGPAFSSLCHSFLRCQVLLFPTSAIRSSVVRFCLLRLLRSRVVRSRIFSRLNLLQIHNKKMFDLDNEGENDETQHLQLCHSIADITIYKRHYIFFVSFTISEILAFQMFYLEN